MARYFATVLMWTPTNAAISPSAMSFDFGFASAGTVTNSIGMTLVLIPAGEFLMGSPDPVGTKPTGGD
ncbi:MAG: hypothetical protein HQ582_31770 [Planctomycetes bacterium]|nr:hypothetical protein [Planctomycetota bacterium]